MPSTTRTGAKNRAGTKSLLHGLKMSTAIGAVGLTLAGWGVLAQTEATNAAQAAKDPVASFTNPGQAGEFLAVATAPTPRIRRDAGALARSVPTSTPTPVPTATAEPATTVKLDIVQWVQTNAGDPVAVVRDGSGVLWYVWGDDVPRIEQGQSPQYQPQPVNSRGRSRHS